MKSNKNNKVFLYAFLVSILLFVFAVPNIGSDFQEISKYSVIETENGNDDEQYGVFGGIAVSSEWKIVVNGSENIYGENNNVKKEKNDREQINKRTFWDKIVNIFKRKNYQNQSTNKNTKYLNIDFPKLPIELTLLDGSKIEIVSFDNKIEYDVNGHCSGQLYYRIKKLTNDEFLKFKYRIKLMDSTNFVPEGSSWYPNFNDINVGEVAEGYIQYINIPYSDTYRLVIEIR